jgi:hypothetical protein
MADKLNFAIGKTSHSHLGLSLNWVLLNFIHFVRKNADVGMKFEITRREALHFGLAALAVGTDARAQSSPPPWGQPDASIYRRDFFPRGRRFYKVLEIHLYGGLSPWETFYHRPLRIGAGYRGFQAGRSEVVTDLIWHSDSGSIPNLCSLRPGPDETIEFSSAAGDSVHFGPSTKPLWGSGLLDRTCLVVLQHDLFPHEAAIPYVATGTRLGQPRFAGLGAAIQRRARELEQAASGNRTTPWSYVLEPTGTITTDNIDAFKATGQHPGLSKPVTLQINGGGLIARLQNRRNIRSPEQDKLLAYYRDEYHRMLSYPGHAERARSIGFDNYYASLENTLNAENLAQQLGGAIVTVGDDRVCVSPGATQPIAVPNQPAAGLRSAAGLLSHPTMPAHYVCVIDSGMQIASGGGPAYDTHGLLHSSTTSINLWNTLAVLRQLVDAGKLDLDSTLIVLTTEFGRTPFRSSLGVPTETSDGRDHWPQGYVNVLIGGPIRSRRILGRILDGNLTGGSEHENGYADLNTVLNATDVKAAVLLAAGIDPFANGLFGGADVSHPVTGDNVATARNIAKHFFG